MDTVQLNIFNIQTYKLMVWENSRLNIYMFYNDTVSFLSYLFIFYQYRNDHCEITDFRDEEFGCLRALVNSPLKLIGCYLKSQLDNLAHGCTVSSTTRLFPAHAQHYFVFDVTGIFHLISAGADLLNGMSR